MKESVIQDEGKKINPNLFPGNLKLFRIQVKKIIARLLLYSGILDIFIYLSKKIKKNHKGIIILYHRIFSYDYNNGFLFKSETVNRDLKYFERDIAYLKKRYDILSLDTIISHLDKRKTFGSPFFAITFDDGFLDNYTLAFPVLKKYNISATIFLVTGLIGSNRTIWTEELSHSIYMSNLKKLTLPSDMGGEEIFLTSVEEKEKSNIYVAEKLKNLLHEERVKCLEEIFYKLKPDLNKKTPLKSNMLLGWDEIREMSESGITFGAHTHTHPILSQLDEKKAKEEISLSKEIIEQHVGKTVHHFAFPNGRYEDFTDALRIYCRDTGFKSIVTAEFGNIDVYSDPFSLNRVGINPDFACWVLDIARLLFIK